MKFLTPFFFISILSANTQAHNFGILAGFSLVDVKEGSNNGNDIIGDELGYRVGPVLQFEVGDFIDLRTGVLYSSRNYVIPNFIAGFPPQLDTSDVIMKYIDLPFLFHLNFTRWFAIYAGPVIAWNVKSEQKDSSNSFDINNARSPYIFAQAGLNLKLGWLGLDFYQERGFGEIYGGGEEDYTIYGLNFIVWFNTVETISKETYYRSRLRE